MTFDEIKSLKEMGFSNAEIMTLSGSGAGAPAEQPEPAPVEQPEPANTEPEQPPAEPEPANTEITELKQTVHDMQAEMKKFITAMQKNNLQTASMNYKPDEDLDQKASEALSELIRPKLEENKGGSKK